MGKYSDDAEWADVVPLPQDDGGPNPLAAIAYTDEYTEAMSYLRAVMAKNEMSERALALTEDIIDMNAAHYTVWLYRARILTTLDIDLRTEVDWLNETALRHLKNYQIWHHRQFVLDRIGSPAGETDFIGRMFEQDAKNYHVWSYRQWLVRRFGLWEEGELEETERLLEKDVRNNSAWNHRFFVVNGRDAEGVEEAVGVAAGVKDDQILKRELSYAEQAVRKAPQNQSPWHYLRGTLDRAGKPLSTVKAFAGEFASLDDFHEVHSSHALDILAEIYSQEEGQKAKAQQAYDLLAKKYDPIRANYWNYLSSRLEEQDVAA